MFIQSVLVTGCNKGIGLEFVRQLADRTKFLFAACRTPSTELSQLANAHSNITILNIDVTNEEQITQGAAEVSSIVKDVGLCCLINNAGVVNYEHTCIENVSSESLLQSFHTNAVGPAMMTKAFLPSLRQASKSQSSLDSSVPKSSIINISSKTASLDDNRSGRLYGSRLSKVALNMLTKNLSLELKNDGIMVAAFNPGWVKTANGGENALITTEESVSKMLSNLSKLTDKDTGCFLSYDGSIIPW